MTNLVTRMKAGRGHKVYVWYNFGNASYTLEWFNADGILVDREDGISANEAAMYMFREEWGGIGDWPVKFYIRRARAGVEVIDHARERGL